MQRDVIRFLTPARATHAVYGSMIVLAVISGLDEASATAREAFVTIIGLAIAVGLSQVYADVIGSTFREGRSLLPAEWLEISANVAFGFGAALVPAIFFALADVGVMSLRHAFVVAEWTGVAVIWFYVFTAARAAQLTLVRAFAWSAALTVCGVGIVELKLLAHPHG
ncbi:MAG TPA: hypothetical protein VHS03_12125 [Gaiellaceae bacterium]|nr:hypothetical protein [Gaiellaceae bacterium]